MQTGGGEDLMTLEQEITELQRENAKVESQMMRLKSDINAMETHLSQGERVSGFFLGITHLNNVPLVSHCIIRHNFTTQDPKFTLSLSDNVDRTNMAPNLQL